MKRLALRYTLKKIKRSTLKSFSLIRVTIKGLSTVNFKRLSNQKGSYTLEAALILPTIFLILFSLVYFSMYLYEKFNLLDTAIYAAKQRAATWENSNKSLENGFQAAFTSDGLYWRVFDDNLIIKDDDLVPQKLAATNSLISQRLGKGALKQKTLAKPIVDYENYFFKRRVKVTLQESVVLPKWVNNLASNMGYTAVADVTEPVEYIRNIELGKKYSQELLDGIQDLFGKLKDKNKQQEKQGCLVIVSTQSVDRVYHYPGCRYIKTIKSENYTEYPSEAEAAKDGYRLCLICAGRVFK